jgi:hypothetical protein
MTTTIWTRREDAAELQCLFACRLNKEGHECRGEFRMDEEATDQGPAAF